jgi:hypothetical protein
MAHFAELDSSNNVIRVIVVGNPDCLDDAGNESEAVGIAFCQQLFGADTRWLQTSYNGNIRKRYAGIGYTYDPTLDAFIPPQPFPSWTLDTATCNWQPPIPCPDDGQLYDWDEAAQAWTLNNQEQAV